jgi:hypothetical protein
LELAKSRKKFNRLIERFNHLNREYNKAVGRAESPDSAMMWLSRRFGEQYFKAMQNRVDTLLEEHGGVIFTRMLVKWSRKSEIRTRFPNEPPLTKKAVRSAAQKGVCM